MDNFLKEERSGAVVTLTMNRPDVRNALGAGAPIDEFVAACERISRDASVRAVIITGAGSAFSSGGNVKAMRSQWKDRKEGAAIREELRAGVQRLTLALYELEAPTIAAVNGPAIGGGCDLACMCDMRIASEKATFATNFVKVGIVPALGGAWLLPRLLGMSRAAEMCFTGDVIDASEALACGLVSRVVPHDTLLDEANRLAQRIAANPGHSLRMTKRLLREGQKVGLETMLEMAAGFQALAHQTRHHEEAVKAFEQKRKPEFTDD
jgi:enoyl-CoA hydratase/carnithine racemase